MRVLITGTGLIGCHTARELADRGDNVWLYDLSPNSKYVEGIAGRKGIKVIQGDILDLPAMLRAMKESKPSVVVHTAGFIGNQVSNPPYRGLQTNVLGAAHVFEASQLSGVGRVVHVSTFSVYDWENIRRGPVKENFPRWGKSFLTAYYSSSCPVLAGIGALIRSGRNIQTFARWFPLTTIISRGGCSQRRWGACLATRAPHRLERFAQEVGDVVS